mmetsp:Transcript_22344/g.49992  ORF Transcript_22344/g.49992 Transcript_22344/m.49992 type:complete len:182 (+) Transcript_22344:616-1161(+)
MQANLVTALHADADAVKLRYATLLNILKYEHKVDYIPDPDILSFVRPRDLTDLDNEKRIAGELANRRTSERAASESRAANVAARFVTLNETLRAEAQARVSAITSEAVSDAVELGRLWEAREAYRVNVAARNQSVQFLLKRAAEARGVAAAAEEKARLLAEAEAEKLRKEEEKRAGKSKKK